MKVAVYGSLMSGLHNHDYHLKDSKYIGQFESEPVFELLDLGSFPGLIKNGHTSVTMEVYEIDDITLAGLDVLEGYNSNSPQNSHYRREMLKTPYGECYCYIYNSKKSQSYKKVKEGNWKDYRYLKEIIAN
jgi:gamma-glutamylcyclotransferase (GGCT)/AIG2-like uncharacterized protein YtfP